MITNDEYRLLYWQIATEGMDLLEIPENGYNAKNKKSKGARFATFVKEFIGKALKGEATDVRFFETLDGLPGNYQGNVDGNWWKQAKKLGDGKAPKNSIIPAMQNPKKEEVDAVMNAFLPLYRAVKESSERRPFWQWITNHSQYVAEKETAKALRGLLMSLTGSSESELAERLDTYCKQVNGENFTLQERSTMLSLIRGGAKIDFFDEPVEVISIEEALKKDPYEAYLSRLPKRPKKDSELNPDHAENESKQKNKDNTELNDDEYEDDEFEFEPDQVEFESTWKTEDETEFESGGFEFNPEHITKKTKWSTKDNENLVSIFDEADENPNADIILDENGDPERMRCPVNEELVSIDSGVHSEVVDDRSAIMPHNISK